MRPETVLITGCSSGIGRATAEAFLDDGWEVYATARNPADIEALGQRDNCAIGTLDVTDDADVERVVDRVAEETGGVDVLVNNAGYAQFGPTEEVAADDVREQFEVNVFAPHRLTRAVLPQLREAGDGTVVNVSSVVAWYALPGCGAYAGSKAALERMTDSLRREVEGHGVDAVLVEPGPVDSKFTDRAASEVDGDSAVERTGAYDWFWSVFEDYSTARDGPWAIEPERVADEILNAASMTDPPARVPVGPVALLASKTRFLPDWLQDAVVRTAKDQLA